MTIRIINNITSSLEKQLNELINKCNGYEPFYNCGYPHIAAFSDDLSTLTGILTFLPDNHMSAEISALVDPEFQHKGVFSAMYAAAAPVLAQSNITNTYCALPEYMLNSSINKGLLYTEYLMHLTKDNFKNIYPSFINTNNPLNLEFFFSDDYTCYLGYLPAENSDEPVCVCNLEYEESFTNIYGVYVDEELRANGIGTLLITNLIADYFENETLPLILNVTDKNTAAYKLYKKCGFAAASHISYYQLIN